MRLPNSLASLSISALLAMPLSNLHAAEEVAFRYQVSLNAPSEVRSLLEQHLDIFKQRKTARLSVEQLDRMLQGLPQAVDELLATEGYFVSQVSYSTDNNPPQQAVHVKIQVNPGPRTQVRSSVITLTGPIATQEESAERYQNLQKLLKQRGHNLEGEPFSQAQWDELKKRTLALVSARQFAAAKITRSAAQIDPLAHMANLSIELDSGPAYVFGDVSIKGIERYPEQLILDRIQIDPGTEYRRNEILDLQTELQNMPHFASALVEVELPDEAPFIAPIRIEVQEAQSNKVNAGLGYSSNTGAKGEFAYRYLNLLSRGWTWDSQLRLEQKEQAANFAVTIPKIHNGWEHQSGAAYKRTDLEGVESQQYKVGVQRSKSEGDIERMLVLQYQTERRLLGNGDIERPSALTLNFKWTQRAVDNVKNPRNGYLLQAEMGGALKAVLSDANYARAYARGLRYLRLGADGVLISRLEAGQTFVDERSKMPTEWLFRAGGTGSVRGYDYESLGLHDLGSTLPGRVIASSSLEYQHPVAKDWRAAIFFDYGGASDEWGSLQAVKGAGVGARWQSTVGQIGADLAYGIDAQQVRLHFAMGLAF